MRIVIFANGLLNQPELLKAQLRPGDHIFCADGGTHNALQLGLTPEAIIGDLDSLSPDVIEQMEQKGVAIHRHPANKDHTDLELALKQAIARQPNEVLVVTALGGRIDQMLANILVLTRSEYASTHLSLADGPQWATIIRAPQRRTIQGHPGDTLSLVPLTPEVTQVTLTGVKWPLEQATLRMGSTWSISNQLTGPQATVQIGRGMVLLVQFNQKYEEDLRK